jgi:hypothetical protein
MSVSAKRGDPVVCLSMSVRVLSKVRTSHVHVFMRVCTLMTIRPLLPLLLPHQVFYELHAEACHYVHCCHGNMHPPLSLSGVGN